MAIELLSYAFVKGGKIPQKYTCDDLNVSPPLNWDKIPNNTKSIAIICDDPDIPMGTWVHWVLFNLPAKMRALSGYLPTDKILPNGAKQGINDFGKIGYGGPCPPGGTHRYYFKIYALDIELNLEGGVTKNEVVKAMAGHVLAEGQLMGKYSR
jgi:Raf kinase inhibitor-like YbhB/YbcL family protein